MKESNTLEKNEANCGESVQLTMNNLYETDASSLISIPSNEPNVNDLMAELDNYRKRFNEMLQIRELMLRRSYETHIHEMNKVGAEILEKLKETAKHADSLQLALSCAITQLVNLKESCTQMAPFFGGIENNLSLFNGQILTQTTPPYGLILSSSNKVNNLNGQVKETLITKNNDSLLKMFLSNGNNVENGQALNINAIKALGIITPASTLQEIQPIPNGTDSKVPHISPNISSTITIPILQPSPILLPSVIHPPGPSPISVNSNSAHPLSVVNNISPRDSNVCTNGVLSPGLIQVKMEPLDVKMEPMELDTVLTAHKVREILANHNIGQRLFARNVLGLSQGTVSELLSKPKSWDRLTERGRDLYRKMDQWASNESNYISLKFAPTISSIKVPQKIAPAVSNLEETLPTGDRIVQILKQAQVAMNIQHSIMNHQHSKLTDLQASQTLSSFLNNKTHEVMATKVNTKHTISNGISNLTTVANLCSSLNNNTMINNHTNLHNGKKFSYDDSPSDSLSFVTRIYREQLLDLLKTAERNKNVTDVIKYQRELNRINGSQKFSESSGNEDQPEDLSVPGIQNPLISSAGTQSIIGKFAMSETDVEFEGKMELTEMNDTFEGSDNHLWHLNKDLNTDEVVQRVKELLNEYTMKQQEDLSSVQNLIYSNSSIDHEATESMSSSSSDGGKSKILRSHLLPITNEQWEQCADICTDDIVQRVKEILNEYSISQRLFGEYILGLSQGSVSDLLARPKPYQLLTQKGREPFVRMKYFLENPSMLHNFVMQQAHAESHTNVTNAHYVIRKRRSTDDGQNEFNTNHKRGRVAFTQDQRSILLDAFKSEPYPVHSAIETLAKRLNVSTKSVLNWFHNQRMRDKDRYSFLNGSNKQEEDSDGDEGDDITDEGTELGDELINLSTSLQPLDVDDDHVSRLIIDTDPIALELLNLNGENSKLMNSIENKLLEQSPDADAKLKCLDKSDLTINLTTNKKESLEQAHDNEQNENLETVNLKIKILFGKGEKCPPIVSKRKRNRPQRFATDANEEEAEAAAVDVPKEIVVE